MPTHLLAPNFFEFLDQLVLEPAVDPWEHYRRGYLDRHPNFLRAWWAQCFGRPEEEWADRVRGVRPEHYVLLRELVTQIDLEKMWDDTWAACRQALPAESREPEVYFMVGFFSPDAFVIKVGEDWRIGVGLERFWDFSRLSVLLAHECCHWFRRGRGLGGATTLGERLVEEGMAVGFSRRAQPDRPLPQHLLMPTSQFNTLQRYETLLWEQIEPDLSSADTKVIQRALYGLVRRRGTGAPLPSRAGVYLGWRLVEEYAAQSQRPWSEVLATAAEEILAGRQAQSGQK